MSVLITVISVFPLLLTCPYNNHPSKPPILYRNQCGLQGNTLSFWFGQNRLLVSVRIALSKQFLWLFTIEAWLKNYENIIGYYLINATSWSLKYFTESNRKVIVWLKHPIRPCGCEGWSEPLLANTWEYIFSCSGSRPTHRK